MKSNFSGIVKIAAVALVAALAIPSQAQGKSEYSLLGIKMWNRYSDVMQKFGPPTRIEVGAVTGNSGQLGGMAGGDLGGSIGGPAMGGGMRSGGKSGMPGMGGLGMAGPAGMGSMGMAGPAGMGMMGSPSGGQGMMGSSRGRGGGMAGMGMMGADGPGGMSMGGPAGPGSSMGGMGLGGDNGAQGDGSEGEITWVYEKGPITNYFLFNKDGRVIQIQSFGYAGSAVTSRGIHLGDSIARIYGSNGYGWTSAITKDSAANSMTLDYSKERNVYFQLVDRKDGKGYRVVGITVGLTDKVQIKSLGGVAVNSGSGGMGMMGGGSSMGMRGSGGMSQKMGGKGMGAMGGGGGGMGRKGGGAISN